RVDAAAHSACYPRISLRRHAARVRAHRQARVLLPGAPGSEPGAARSGIPLRPVCANDGEALKAKRKEIRKASRGNNDAAGPRSSVTKMPRRTDIESILIIGAGPIIIGQACEFDYSGAQACKALREEGYKVILVNS